MNDKCHKCWNDTKRETAKFVNDIADRELDQFHDIDNMTIKDMMQLVYDVGLYNGQHEKDIVVDFDLENNHLSI